MQEFSSLISYLLSPIEQINKTGSKTTGFLVNLVGSDHVIDLLYHFPEKIYSKKYLPDFSKVRNKEIIITTVTVDCHLKPFDKRHPFLVRCHNKSGFLTVTFFKLFPGYIDKYFAIGSKVALSGRVEYFNNELQIVHPDYVLPEAALGKIPRQEIIYPLVSGVTQKLLRSKIDIIFEHLKYSKNFPEWIDHNFVQQNNWPDWKKALFALHNPKQIADDGDIWCDPFDPARRRLAYDELLAAQFAMIIARRDIGYNNGRINIGNGFLRHKLRSVLPFVMTDAQEKAIAEIECDMGKTAQMLRLLQGDVGSGKTIVALFAMLSAVELKRQTALIVPIALLAQQHFNSLSNLAKDLEINIAILTSKTTKREKREILQNLKNGKIDIIIGTQALIYEEVQFNDLAMIVIDEQHRFGVLQRLELIKKGNRPDILLMSATPIPRSLMMTFYGDMNISILDQKPANRKAIDTRIISDQRLEEVYQAIQRAVNNGEKIYWICPLIEESEEIDNSNVTIRHDLFRQRCGENKVGLLHGKMNNKEKDQIMSAFADPFNAMQILVATTVIEVGIDVKDATIIVIENCEQFGLSQLHQLRGRVGRSDKNSYCIMLYSSKIGKTGKQRLSVMRNSNDGFVIAEEDLKMRGGGQILGTRQSGLPEYKIANLIYDTDLLRIAGKNAQLILNRDPHLKSEQGRAVKILLQLFKYDKCVALLQGG